tara:strand:- start:324 stop:923 length:600 start_codon:yes stop_codon:yes gene_type:complete
MITFLRGKISFLNENSIEIDVSGVGYKCMVSLNTSKFFSDKVNDEIMILTYHHINETSQALFGFFEKEEKDMFELLISVSGVGPKTAIQFFSSASADDIRSYIKSGEVKALTSIPGIGPKTAKRIIIDIKEKITSISDDDIPNEEVQFENSNNKDAIDALLVLGYSKKDIIKCINQLTSESKLIETPELIKKVLNQIGK